MKRITLKPGGVKNWLGHRMQILFREVLPDETDPPPPPLVFCPAGSLKPWLARRLKYLILEGQHEEKRRRLREKTCPSDSVDIANVGDNDAPGKRHPPLPSSFQVDENARVDNKAVWLRACEAVTEMEWHVFCLIEGIDPSDPYANPGRLSSRGVAARYRMTQQKILRIYNQAKKRLEAALCDWKPEK